MNAPAPLASRHCQVCNSSTPTFHGDDLQSWQAQLSGEWKIANETSLSRNFKFVDFASAFTLATKIALLAESEQHHPDMEVGWGKLRVILTTHAAGGLTQNDFIMAAKIDKISPGLRPE